MIREGELMTMLAARIIVYQVNSGMSNMQDLGFTWTSWVNYVVDAIYN
jgi:hypothetical protein